MTRATLSNSTVRNTDINWRLGERIPRSGLLDKIRKAVLAFGNSPFSTQQAQALIGGSHRKVSNTLSKMSGAGELSKLQAGMWRLAKIKNKTPTE